MMLLWYKPLFDALVQYLAEFNGVIYITGVHGWEFYRFLKNIHYPRKFKFAYWNWQFKHATLIVRFRSDPYGIYKLEREVLTEDEIAWEKKEHLQLRGYY